MILLLWKGDYPGQGKVSGFVHAGGRACHFCEQLFKNVLPGHDVFTDTRRFMHDEAAARVDESYGAIETRAAPVRRTTHKACREGRASSSYSGPKSGHPKHATGIIGWCVLSLLVLFDVIWDIPMDMMHIIKGFFQSHMMPLFKGDRRPAHLKEPAKTRKVRGEDVPFPEEEMRERTAAHAKKKATWSKAYRVTTVCRVYVYPDLTRYCNYLSTIIRYHNYLLTLIRLIKHLMSYVYLLQLFVNSYSTNLYLPHISKCVSSS